MAIGAPPSARLRINFTDFSWAIGDSADTTSTATADTDEMSWRQRRGHTRSFLTCAKVRQGRTTAILFMTSNSGRLTTAAAKFARRLVGHAAKKSRKMRERETAHLLRDGLELEIGVDE